MDGEGAVVWEWKTRTAPRELDAQRRDLGQLSADTPMTPGLEAATVGKETFAARLKGRSLLPQ